MNTFEYCGIKSSVFNCYYVPDETDRFDDKADFEVYDEDYDFHDGGVYYGNSVKKREFELKCYFEDIDRATKEKMMLWLDRKTSGRLVFEDTPWKYYNVRPTKKLTGKTWVHRNDGSIRDLYSGTFSIVFTAYEPFGFMTMDRLYGYDKYGVSQYCNILQHAEMPAAPEAGSGNQSFLLYNCGTQTALPIIRIGGNNGSSVEYSESNTYNTGDIVNYNGVIYQCVIAVSTSEKFDPNKWVSLGSAGMTIVNEANNTRCKITQMPPAGSYLEIDSEQGLVTEHTNGTYKINFSYHDDGYIVLEPCGFVDVDVAVSYSADSDVIRVSKPLDKSYIGKYVYIGGMWKKITDIGDQIHILGRMSSSGTENTKIVTMNRIVIEGPQLNIDSIEVEFKPRVH